MRRRGTKTTRGAQAPTPATPAAPPPPPPAAPAAPAPTPDFLLAETGQSTAYWLARMEALIAEHTKPLSEEETKRLGLSPGHGHTEADRAFAALFVEVAQRAPTGDAYDGNMWLAKVYGLILVLWYARLSFAKAHDPVRPVSLRQRAYRTHLAFVSAALTGMVDVQQDATVWSRQKWQSPFTPQSTSGTFI